MGIRRVLPHVLDHLAHGVAEALGLGRRSLRDILGDLVGLTRARGTDVVRRPSSAARRTSPCARTTPLPTVFAASTISLAGFTRVSLRAAPAVTPTSSTVSPAASETDASAMSDTRGI